MNDSILGPRRPFDLRSIGIVCWFTSVVVLSTCIVAYMARPGDAGAVVNHWPPSTPLERGPAATVVVFCHERCPCTRATIRQLARIRTSAPEGTRIIAVTFDPPSASESGSPALDLSELGSELEVIEDSERREFEIFGVRTSGHVLAYDRGGQLLFSGGITAGRGHEGDNAGSLALSRALTTEVESRSASPTHRPVWGCPLFGEESSSGDSASGERDAQGRGASEPAANPADASAPCPGCTTVTPSAAPSSRDRSRRTMAASTESGVDE